MINHACIVQKDFQKLSVNFFNFSMVETIHSFVKDSQDSLFLIQVSVWLFFNKFFLYIQIDLCSLLVVIMYFSAICRIFFLLQKTKRYLRKKHFFAFVILISFKLFYCVLRFFSTSLSLCVTTLCFVFLHDLACLNKITFNYICTNFHFGSFRNFFSKPLTFTLPEVFYDVIMPYAIQINDVILWGLRRPHWQC